jgi:hypothetical protein
MLLGGLWHGAGWTFVIWGGLHGFYLVVNHLWRKTPWRMPPIGGWALTFLAVVVAWVFFRAVTLKDALVMLKGMAGMNGIVLTSYTPFAEHLSQFSIFIINHDFTTMTTSSTQYVVLAIGVAMTIALFFPNLTQITRNYSPTLYAKGLEKVTQIDFFPWLTDRMQYHPTVGWLFILFMVSVFGLMFIQTTSEFLYFQF